jgi:hypothetical protein
MVKLTDQIQLKEEATVRVQVHDKQGLRTDDKLACSWPGCTNRVTAGVNEFPSCDEHVAGITKLVMKE